MGTCKENLGEYPKSIHYFNYALSLKSSIKNYKALARVYAKNRNFLNSLDYYSKAMAKFPLHAELFALKADIHRKIKQYDTAIKHYDQAIKLDYGNNDYYIKRAFLKYYTDDIQGCINDYTAAISHKPNESFLYEQRAFYKMEKKLYTGAKEDYSQAIKLNPNNHHLYFMRASVEKLLGEEDLSNQDFEKAKQLSQKAA